ncbi:MAG TPA: ATP-grasp domain-containing protein, partial [bacterium]|nr:ATP-grasp domain-containing protein [bacterium]
MKIHEYQAKTLFKQFGIPVPEGIVCKTADDVFTAAQKMGAVLVVKAQIHAGGRGKGQVLDRTNQNKLVLDGGVKVVKSAEEAKAIASQMLGNTLVTHQTGPSGKTVKTVLVETACHIKKEYYLGLVLDRTKSRITFLASAEGGMDI